MQMKLCRRKSEKRADRVVHPYMVRRKIGGTGGQGRPPLRVRRKIGGTGGQSRPPLRVRGKIGGCNDVLLLLPNPHPSASQTPSPEGKAIRCGGGRAVLYGKFMNIRLYIQRKYGIVRRSNGAVS